MGIWKSLFGKEEKEGNQVDKSITVSFRELTILGIELIGRDSREMENEELYMELACSCCEIS